MPSKIMMRPTCRTNTNMHMAYIRYGNTNNCRTDQLVLDIIRLYKSGGDNFNLQRELACDFYLQLKPSQI